MSYTLGPWVPIRDAQGPCMVMHPTRRGVAIASLTDAHTPHHGFHDDGERNANAWLISAAPELLEALKAALEYHGADNDWGDDALAAIAKAEGRT